MKQFTGRATSHGVSLPAELWALLRQMAKQEDRKLSTVVRRLIVQGLEKGQGSK